MRSLPSSKDSPATPPSSLPLSTHELNSLVQMQTAEYSAMIRRHTVELHQLRSAQLRERYDTLRKLMEQTHKQQTVDLKAKLEL